jgi:predicted DNA binding CopG/RHH family protein
MNKERIDAAIKNVELMCEQIQANLKTHQQLQSDLQILKDLQKFWLEKKETSESV